MLMNDQKHRARNSARIRESILAMILVASRYENQFLSLNYVVNTTVTQNFDSRKSKRNSTPESRKKMGTSGSKQTFAGGH